MKTLGRIVIILVAALVVVGATWAVGQSGGNSGGNSGSFARRTRPEFSAEAGRPARPDGELREFGERGGRDGAQLLSLRGWLGFGQTLVPMAIIIALVALPTSLWKKRRRAQRSTTSAIPV
ncbi:MAG: hypothetical protein R2932_34805 [Caldilineaceae bacterium]